MAAPIRLNAAKSPKLRPSCGHGPRAEPTAPARAHVVRLYGIPSTALSDRVVSRGGRVARRIDTAFVYLIDRTGCVFSYEQPSRESGHGPSSLTGPVPVASSGGVSFRVYVLFRSLRSPLSHDVRDVRCGQRHGSPIGIAHRHDTSHTEPSHGGSSLCGGCARPIHGRCANKAWLPSRLSQDRSDLVLVPCAMFVPSTRPATSQRHIAARKWAQRARTHEHAHHARFRKCIYSALRRPARQLGGQNGTARSCRLAGGLR